METTRGIHFELTSQMIKGRLGAYLRAEADRLQAIKDRRALKEREAMAETDALASLAELTSLVDSYLATGPFSSLAVRLDGETYVLHHPREKVYVQVEPVAVSEAA